LQGSGLSVWITEDFPLRIPPNTPSVIG
jgi:hypothetical protein